MLTVAIPAYNRPTELGELLDSTLSQEFDDFETLVAEDCSPKADEIRRVVQEKAAQYPQRRVRFVTNERNLGYDGNIRNCLSLARGEFTFFMGDDDLLRPGALKHVAKAIAEQKNLGVILRAYEQVDFRTGERLQLFRYFPTDRLFRAGADTIRTFFRRSVSVAGFTIHTASANAVATTDFDGTLLYQLYLSGMVLQKRDGFFIADVLTAMRKDERQRHFFGSASAEKGLFAPGALTANHSLTFMEGMFRIAREVERRTGLPVYDGIAKDIGNYSYAFLKLHAHDRRTFAGYVKQLAQMGLARNPYFWLYSAALFCLPAPLLDRGIASLKAILPATPRLGDVYAGEEVRPS